MPCAVGAADHNDASSRLAVSPRREDPSVARRRVNLQVMSLGGSESGEIGLPVLTQSNSEHAESSGWITW